MDIWERVLPLNNNNVNRCCYCVNNPIEHRTASLLCSDMVKEQVFTGQDSAWVTQYLKTFRRFFFHQCFHASIKTISTGWCIFILDLLFKTDGPTYLILPIYIHWCKYFFSACKEDSLMMEESTLDDKQGWQYVVYMTLVCLFLCSILLFKRAILVGCYFFLFWGFFCLVVSLFSCTYKVKCGIWCQTQSSPFVTFSVFNLCFADEADLFFYDCCFH